MPAIDFMSLIRGRRLAEQDNRADRRAAFQEFRQHTELEELLRRQQEEAMRRQAQRYTSTFDRNLNIAAQAGVSRPEFMQQQLQQVRTDPAFQRMDPEVQSLVISDLTTRAQSEANRLFNVGEGEEANALAAAYGFAPSATPNVLATQQGDIAGFARQLQEQFPGAVVNEDNTVTFNGQSIPIDSLMLLSGSVGVGPALLSLSAQGRAQGQAEAQDLRNANLSLAPFGLMLDASGNVVPTSPQASAQGPDQSGLINPILGTQGPLPGVGAPLPLEEAPVASPATPAQTLAEEIEAAQAAQSTAQDRLAALERLGALTPEGSDAAARLAQVLEEARSGASQAAEAAAAAQARAEAAKTMDPVTLVLQDPEAARQEAERLRSLVRATQSREAGERLRALVTALETFGT